MDTVARRSFDRLVSPVDILLVGPRQGLAEDLDVDRLIVRSITADDGPMLKRWGTKARGRGTRILKPTCHITVVLSEKTSV